MDRLWVACTDGDSVVPRLWLVTHLQHAAAGVDLLLGMVTPDEQDLSTGALHTWQSRHPAREGHDHIFGANLGVRADTYLRAGGFASVGTGEDHLLAQSVRRAGGLIVATAISPVMTSARQVGRAPEGFAHYLHQMITVDIPDRPAPPPHIRR